MTSTANSYSLWTIQRVGCVCTACSGCPDPAWQLMLVKADLTSSFFLLTSSVPQCPKSHSNMLAEGTVQCCNSACMVCICCRSPPVRMRGSDSPLLCMDSRASRSSVTPLRCSMKPSCTRNFCVSPETASLARTVQALWHTGGSTLLRASGNCTGQQAKQLGALIPEPEQMGEPSTTQMTSDE